MIDDPLALHASFYSVVVKASAVTRSFPGGIEGFDAQLRITRRTTSLLLLVYMSVGDVEHVLDKLQRAGLEPGEDLAVGDMMLGPLLPCPGIVFEDVGDGPISKWTVTAIPVGE